MPQPDSRDPSDLRADAISHGIQLLLIDKGYSDREALALLYELDDASLARVWLRLPMDCCARLVVTAECGQAPGLPPNLAEFFDRGFT